MALRIPSNPVHASLGVDSVLIPPPSLFRDDEPNLNTSFDSSGCSTYARGVLVLIRSLLEDRTLARSNIWSLEHLWTFSILVDDWLALPSDSKGLFSKNADQEVIQEYGNRAKRIAAYLTSRPLGERWHTNVTSAIQTGSLNPTIDDFGRFIVDLFKKAIDQNSILLSRVVFVALQHVFSSIDKEDADRWILLLRKIEKHGTGALTAIQTRLLITFNSTSYRNCSSSCSYPLCTRTCKIGSLSQRDGCKSHRHPCA